MAAWARRKTHSASNAAQRTGSRSKTHVNARGWHKLLPDALRFGETLSRRHEIQASTTNVEVSSRAPQISTTLTSIRFDAQNQLRLGTCGT